MKLFFCRLQKKSDKILPPPKINSFPEAAFLELRFVSCRLIIFPWQKKEPKIPLSQNWLGENLLIETL